MRSTTAYYLFNLLFRLGVGATLTLYTPWLANGLGLSYAQIALVNAVYWSSVILLEVPTGMIADGRGRGWSVLMGALAFSTGSVFYYFATGLMSALIAEVMLALGTAFISGALTAWIVDAPDRTESKRTVFANVTAMNGLVMAFMPLVAVPIVAQFRPSSFWLISAFFVAIAAVIAWFFMQASGKEQHMSEFEALRNATQHLRRSASLRWAVSVQVATGVFYTFNMFWAILLLTRMNEYQVSWVWTLMFGAMALSGWAIRTRWAQRFTSSMGMLASFLVGSAPLVVMWFFPVTSVWIVLVVIHEMGRGAFGPFADEFVHERIESGYRATYGSLQSFLGSLGNVVTLLAASLFMAYAGSTTSSILTLWMLAGGFGIVSAGILWSTRPSD